MTPALVMGLGLAVGLQHAFEPDHIAAVSTQVSHSKFSHKSIKQILKQSITKSSLLGAIWGAGHTTSLVLMGLLVYVFAITIQETVFSGLEFLVGMMLVFLGATTILNKKIIKLKHKHPHEHKDGLIHFDEHEHNDDTHTHSHKSYAIGLIHGLAGSGSLVVLTAASLNNVGLILEFIVIFGIGSIIGMTIVGSLMGVPLALSKKISGLQKFFRFVAGGLSLLIGVNILYQIGIIENLLGF